MRNINLASFRGQKRSGRSLLVVGLLCLILGSSALMVVLFMKPGVKRPQLVGERIRLPITSIEKEEGPGIQGIVEEEEPGKPLEGGILEEEKAVVSELSESSIMIEKKEVGNKKVLILGEKGAPKEDEEATVAVGERERPGIAGKEEGKPRVAMVEEPKRLAVPEGKPLTGGYTVNVASFKDKGNADRLMKELDERGYEAFIEKANIPQKGTWYRVAVGRFSSRGEALAFAQGLRNGNGVKSFFE